MSRPEARYRSILGGLVAIAALTSFSPSSQRSGRIPESCSFAVGTNLDGFAYWTTALPFLDLSKQAGDWLVQRPGSWDTEEALALSGNGWPASMPADRNLGLIITREVQPALPQSDYRLTYEGSAEVRGMLGTTVRKVAADRHALRSADDGSVHLTFHAPSGPMSMKRFSLVAEDRKALLDSGKVFNPEWTRHLRPFSTIRFMDWSAANKLVDAEGAEAEWREGHGFDVAKRPLNWSDRPRVDDLHWTRGVPVEILVRLANELKIDPWFNMPVNATDDYVRGFATYVRDHLHKDATIRVELSNEVWNGIFPQSSYANARAKELWGKDAAGLEWYGMRTAEIGKIWNGVFGEPVKGGPAKRVRIVFGTQFVWKGREVLGLETRHWKDRRGNAERAADYFDDYAITGYYDAELGSAERRSQVREWQREADGGFARAIAEIGRSIDERNAPLYRYHAERARHHGLSLVTYESGYGEAPSPQVRDDKAHVEFLIALQRRPEIEQLEVRNAHAFRDAGGCLFNNFGIVSAPGRYGSWAALESNAQDSSPRYRALLRLSDEARRSDARRSHSGTDHRASSRDRALPN